MAKGGAWEREVCYALSEWWTGSDKDCVFWRSSQSGGRATVRSRKGKKTSGHCGDICATHPSAEPFTRLVTVEAKRGYNKDNVFNFLDKLKTRKPTDFEQWLVQVYNSTKLAESRYWMIVARRTGKKAMVYFPYVLYNKLIQLDSFSWQPKPLIRVQCRIKVDKRKQEVFDFVGMTFSHFLDGACPADFLYLGRRD